MQRLKEVLLFLLVFIGGFTFISATVWLIFPLTWMQIIGCGKWVVIWMIGGGYLALTAMFSKQIDYQQENLSYYNRIPN